MTIGRICNRDVDLAEIGESVQAAAERMLQRSVGTLVVLDESRKPVGILTDRDLATRVLGLKRDGQTLVGEVMTQNVKTVCEETPIEDVVAAMKSEVARRFPVVDVEGKLVGLVSVDDILLLLAEEFTMIGQLLERETPRRVARP